MPIRARIALFGAGIVGLTILLFSVLLYALVVGSLDSEQDKALRKRAQQAVQALERFTPKDFQSQPARVPVDLRESVDVFVAVLGPDGRPITSTGEVDGAPPAIPPGVLDGTVGHSATISPVDGLPLRVYLLPWSRPDLGLNGQVVAGQAVRGRREQLQGMRAFLVLSGLVSLAGASLAIWLVLGRALRPLRVMAATAGEIARTGDLSRRLPPVRTRDEVRLMTDSFNAMLQRLQDTYHRLAGALAAQKRFVADASHELRTPLTTIRSNAGFLLQRPDAAGEDRQAALADIAGESERMSRLVHDLLTLARADAGHTLEKAPLDLVPLVHEVGRQARNVHPTRCIAVEDEGAAVVLGNADALTQLVWILVDNAARHTRDGGHIRLWAGNRLGRAVVHVTDDGPGIAPAHLERIFERFYQADAARSGGGAGLGLAIARWIVGDHGGRVLAYNNDGGGATFRVELPAAGA